MKKAIFTISAVASVVAPVVTMSCGGKKLSHHTNAGDKITTNVSLFPENINNATIKDFDDSKLDKTPYSLETLRAEAKEIGDDAVWTGSIGASAFQSTISIVRALASAYGYENPGANNISQKDLFFQNFPTDSDKTDSFERIDDEEAAKILADPNASAVKKLLASLHYYTTRQGKSPAESQMYIGDTGFDPSLLKRFGVWTSFGTNEASAMDESKVKYVEFANKDADGRYGFFVDKNNDGKIEVSDEDETNKSFHPFSVWDDFTTPKQRDMLITYADKENNENYYREIKMPNFMDTEYPVIEKSKFKSEYVPYVQASFATLLKCLMDNAVQSLLTIGGDIDINLLIDQIKFILLKNLDSNNNVDFNSQSFVEHIEKINENGTQHFLALKAFYKGFDASFASKRAIAFSLVKPTLSLIPGWPINTPLEGLGAIGDELKASPGDTMTMLKILNGDSQGYTGANGDWISLYGFRADKTIDELYTQIGATPEQIKNIKDTIDAAQ